jgi:ABC-type nitrate/sulfonate/bicarbonate transport system permease component
MMEPATLDNTGAAAMTRPRRAGVARPGLWLIVGLLVLWELSARSGLVMSRNWPPVSAILLSAVRGLGRGLGDSELGDGELLGALGGTLYRMAAGFGIGGAAGVAAGVLMSLSRLARLTLEPAIELLRPLPIPALIPPLILFLGLDDPMKIAVAAFTVFFPVFVNTLHGALAIEPTYRAVAATFGASRFATLWRVLLPATLPYVFAGLRISLGLAFVSVVAAEMVAGDSGVGYYIASMQYAGRGADMFAALFLVGLSGYLINRAFVTIEAHVLFWHRQAD